MRNIISSTLEQVCLQEKGSIISGPFGSNISSKFFVDSGIPVIRGNNLSLGFDKFYDEGFVFVTKEKAEELKCYAYRDDLIFTAAGTIGQVGIIPQNSKYEEYVISNKQIRARIDTKKIDLIYAYYWYSSPWIKSLLIRSNKGSTVPLLTLSEVKDLPISYPEDIQEQKKLVSIIESLSQKIESNNKVNDNLEQQSKLLYDYWFTQFDFPDENEKPYRTSGGKMVWNEQLKRDIPEGWEVKSLAEILQKNTDVFDYKSIQPAVDLSIMPSNSIAISQLNSSDSFTTNLFTMKKGDILFGSIRPYLHKAGFAPCDGVVAGTVHSFRVKNNQDNNFALMTVSRDNFFNYAVNVSSGTKMPVVSSDSILDFKVPYNNKIVRIYNKIPLIAIISSHIQENQKLISLRDWLLPMLMNGQVTISD